MYGSMNIKCTVSAYHVLIYVICTDCTLLLCFDGNFRKFCFIFKYSYYFTFFFTVVPCILILSKFFYLPTDAQENCFKKSILFISCKF